MTMRIVVQAVTAVLMVIVSLFWMFMWLIGSNGYSESKGGLILTSNGVAVLVATIAATVASGWLAHKLASVTTWSPWVVAPLTILGVLVAIIVLLFIVSIVIVIAVG